MGVGTVPVSLSTPLSVAQLMARKPTPAGGLLRETRLSPISPALQSCWGNVAPETGSQAPEHRLVLTQELCSHTAASTVRARTDRLHPRVVQSDKGQAGPAAEACPPAILATSSPGPSVTFPQVREPGPLNVRCPGQLRLCFRCFQRKPNYFPVGALAVNVTHNAVGGECGSECQGHGSGEHRGVQ